jgi:hypothetical protein
MRVITNRVMQLETDYPIIISINGQTGLSPILVKIIDSI